MRFMIFRMADKDTEAGVMPKEELFAAMGSYMEEMHKAGIVRGGDGIQGSKGYAWRKGVRGQGYPRRCSTRIATQARV